jgi:hypothetical protein
MLGPGLPSNFQHTRAIETNFHSQQRLAVAIVSIQFGEISRSETLSEENACD